ncbi:hypothetical protein Q5H93_05305 [Hymenobacter sp. ASUV-10]|uniref:T9SS type A sorting domain-containing protein n=1 Tax=Hymenobacter aranciens TaxID=3063996 RepID=A0ABT9B791_9BACT|nr:hypothetical protein [Hymenobacter sp. ASUV-10]MDO7874141.1 hypothetical protein [Hymenobacter sp. ASUV-10]
MFSTLARVAAVAAGSIAVAVGVLPAARAQTTVPAWQWATRGSNTGGYVTNNEAHQVQQDAAGNTYAYGRFSAQLTLVASPFFTSVPNSGFLVKYTPGGALQWARHLQSPFVGVGVQRMVTDAAGNLYLAGSFANSLTLGSYVLADPAAPSAAAGRSNGFVLKLDALGNVLWGLRLAPEGSSASHHAYGTGLALDATGELVFSGCYEGAADLAGTTFSPTAPNGYGLMLARLGNLHTGTPVLRWARSAETTARLLHVALACDPAGDCYLAADAPGAVRLEGTLLPASSPGAEIVLARYTSAGVLQWAQRPATAVPGLLNATSSVTDLVAPAPGTVCVLSETSRSYPNFYARTLLAQYGAPGTTGWQYDDTTFSPTTHLTSLSTDGRGTVYVVGYLTGGLMVRGQFFQSITPNASNGLLLAFSGRGTLHWGAVVSAGTGTERLYASALGSTGTLSVAGSARGPAQLGPFTLPSPGNFTQPLLGRLALPVITSMQAAASSLLQLAPNPAHSAVILTLPAAAAPQAFVLLDALGRPVRHYVVPAGATSARLDVAGLPAGLYVLRGAGASRKLVLE